MQTVSMDKKERKLLESKVSGTSLSELENRASMGELIAGIAYELNDPLTAILGYSEILQSMDADPAIKRYAHHIHIAAIKSARIMEGLLTYARKKEIELHTININDVIKQTVTLFEYQMRKNKVTLVLNLCSTVWPVKGDFYKLQQVFFNVLINALQSLEEWSGDKRVVISSSMQDHAARIMIANSGPVLDREDITKVFTPFFTTKPGGTGLGLSIAYGIIKEHGGDISVGSEGQGCSFIIELPVVDRDRVISHRKDKMKDFINRRVLIVDDNELVLDAISVIMEFTGCDVVFTTATADAMEKLEDTGFDVVFVGYKMQGMNGLDFIKKASAYGRTKKFVLITSDITLDAGFVKQKYNVPVLQNPISLEALKKAVL